MGAVSLTSTGTIGGSGGITTSNQGLIINAGSGSGTLSGVLALGSGGLTKQGAGTTLLSRANTYTGATTVSAGTLAISNATGLGTTASGTTVASGATLDLRGVTVAAEAITLNGGTLATSTGISILSGAVALGADSTVSVTGTQLTLSGIISGVDFGLTKTGTGTLALSGINTYTGATTISAGTLTLNSTGTIAASSGVANAGTLTIAADKTIDSLTGAGATTLSTFTLTIGDASNTSGSYSGVASGAGGLTTAGTGTLTLGGVNLYTGATTIGSGGGLTLNSSGTIAASSGVANAGTLTIGAAKTIDSMTGAGATTLSTFTLTIGDASNTSGTYSGVASGAGGITKAGTGTWTLAGANTYTGTTTVSAGTLQVGNGGTTGTLGTGAVIDNASLIFNRSDTVSLSALASNAAGITGTGNVTALIGGGFTVDRTINLSGASSNIILEAGVSTPAGTASGGDVTLSSAVTTTAGGTVTIFSGNPDTANLSSNILGASGATQYKTYNAVSSAVSGAVAGTRNFYYRSAPSLTVSGLTASKVYDGNNSAVGFTSGGTISGHTDGDVAFSMANLTQTGGTFNDSNVGSKTLSAAFTANTVTSGGWTVAGYGVNNFSGVGAANISAKALTATVAAASRVYDGSTTAANTLTVAGFVGTETVTATGGATFNSKDVAAANTVTINSTTLADGTNGGLASNYSLHLTGQTIGSTITAKALTITGMAATSRVYNGDTVAALTGGTLDTGITGEALSFTGQTGAFADKNVGTGKTVTVTGTALGDGTGGLASNYSLIQPTVTAANITARALSISATGSNRVYDGLTTDAVTLADNRVTNDVLILTNSAANFADKNVGTAKMVSVTGINVTGADAGNYTFNTTAATTANISAKALSITGMTATSRTYDGSLVAALTGGTLATGITGEALTFTGQTGAFADKNVGTGKTVTVTNTALGDGVGGLASNYSLTQPTVTAANISQRPITVTADDKTKVFGNSDPSLTYQVTIGNLITGDSLSGALTRSAGEDVGNHTINAAALANGNYLITATNGVLTISQRPVTALNTKRNQAADNAVRSAQRQVSSGTNAVAAGSSANATWRSMPSPEQSAGLSPLSSQPIGSTSSNVSLSGGLVFVQVPDSAPNTPTTTGSTADVATSGGTDTSGFMRVSVIRGGINFGEYSETLAR